MAFVTQAGNDSYIDFLSVHMLLKLNLMNLRGIVPIWGCSKAKSPYLISGLVTRLCSLLLCSSGASLSFTSLNAISSADSVAALLLILHVILLLSQWNKLGLL